MTRNEAVERCEELNRSGELFHWLPVRREAGWNVARVPLPPGARGKSRLTATTEPPPLSPHPSPDVDTDRLRWAAGGA
jgi:hypothetical protein